MVYVIKRTDDPQPGEVKSQMVRAASKSEARELAADNCGPEGEDVWTDSTKSRIFGVLAVGPQKAFLKNYSA